MPSATRTSSLLALAAAAAAQRVPETIYADFADELKGVTSCTERDFGSLLLGHLIHYPSDPSYNVFDGHDLVKGSYPEEVASLDGKPKAVLCVGAAAKPGETWYVQRIGPFVSTGGNDWWQFAWNDMFGLDGSLDAPSLLQQGPVAMTGHFTGPVSSSGDPIGLPPLHIHHIHLTPNTGLSWASDILECMLVGDACPDLAVIYAHHGDRQRLEADAPATSGFVTFGEEYGEFAKRLHGPISCTGEINDLRPPQSEPIEWWYQSAIRVVHGAAADPAAAVGMTQRPLSLHYLYNPFEIGLDSQMSRFGTIKVHPNDDSVFYYSGYMPFPGELVAVDGHAHSGAFQRMFLFAGSPEQLGLPELVQPTRTWVPRQTAGALRAIGVEPAAEPADGANNAVLVSRMMARVARSGGDAASPRLICSAVVNQARVTLDRSERALWDRALELECAPWRFEAGSQYTTVVFHGSSAAPTPDQMRTDPGLAYLAVSKATSPFANPPDNTFPCHAHWFLSYATEYDDDSHYTAAIASQDANATGLVFTKMDFLRILVWGVPATPPNSFDYFVLEPVLDVALELLTPFLAPGDFTWFSPWPLLQALALVVAALVALALGLFAFVVSRYGVRAVPKKHTRYSSLAGKSAPPVTLRGQRFESMLAAPDQLLESERRHPICFEVAAYFAVVATVLALASWAFARLVIPTRVYLANDHDAHLLLTGQTPYPDWATGRVDPNATFWTVVGLVVNVLVVGAASLCVGRLRRREVTRARASFIIRGGLKSDGQARDDLVARDHMNGLL